MPSRVKTREKPGFFALLPLAFALSGVVLSILGLILPFASRLTKNPLTKTIVRETMTVSEWDRQHDAAREIGGDGYAFFSAARGFAWVIAIAAGVVLLLLLLSRFVHRSAELNWTVAGTGVLLAFASVVFFVCAVLFAVSAGGEGTRVLLSAGAYLTLSGGIVVGISAFLAVRRAL